jgi:hypothetical protein
VFHRLAAGGTQAQDTLLQTPQPVPMATFVYSLRHGDYVVALAGFSAILSESLFILLSSIPYSSTELHMAFLVSSYASIAIIAVMVLSLPFLFWWRAGNPDLPKNPDTLSVLLSYLCWSDDLLDLFKDVSTLKQKERDNVVLGWAKHYKFGEINDFGTLGIWIED